MHLVPIEFQREQKKASVIPRCEANVSANVFETRFSISRATGYERRLSQETSVSSTPEFVPVSAKATSKLKARAGALHLDYPR